LFNASIFHKEVSSDNAACIEKVTNKIAGEQLGEKEPTASLIFIPAIFLAQRVVFLLHTSHENDGPHKQVNIPSNLHLSNNIERGVEHHLTEVVGIACNRIETSGD